MSALPILPTTVVGSHGKPGWWHACKDLSEQGQWGPYDLEELLTDAAALRLVPLIEYVGVPTITRLVAFALALKRMPSTTNGTTCAMRMSFIYWSPEDRFGNGNPNASVCRLSRIDNTTYRVSTARSPFSRACAHAARALRRAQR